MFLFRANENQQVQVQFKPQKDPVHCDAVTAITATNDGCLLSGGKDKVYVLIHWF